MPKDSPALLTVRDAAQHLNVTPRTLKYYEERGLVTPTRSEGRYRLYTEDDLEQFARILRLRALGFSLHGITEMLKRPLESADAAGELARMAGLAGMPDRAASVDASKPDSLYQTEHALLNDHHIVPLIYLPETYGLAPRVHQVAKSGAFTLPLEDLWVEP